MIEQIAQWLSMSEKYGNFSVWDSLPSDTQETYRVRAGRFIDFLTEEIKKMGNPYKGEQKRLRFNSFERCRYEILNLLENKSKEGGKRTSFRELAEDFRGAMSYRELGEE